jgi:mono/diheme cytochrome c family protein
MTRLKGSFIGRAAVAIALAAGGLAVAGCGTNATEGADIQAGKQTFAACAGCHALADAGSTATIGPDLDDAFRADRQAGMDEEQFAGTVERWIRIAQLPMPRDLVTGQDAKNVAAYIASVAGKSPESALAPLTTTPEVPEPSRQQPEQ